MAPKTQRGFYRQMLQLAIPIALQNLLTSSAQIVDTAMVVSLGNVETAAIGIATRWGFLLNLCMFGISSGCAALASQFWGAKDKHSIHQTYGIGLVISCVIALVYTVCACTIPELMMRVFTNEAAVIASGAQYLETVGSYAIFLAFSLVASTFMRATEDVMTPLICSIISVGTNTVLNYILIFGKLGMPRMELRGAALATFCATVVQAGILLAVGLGRKKIIRAPLRVMFSWPKDFRRRFFRVMLPVLGNEMLWAAGTNIYSMIYARQGSENFAGYTVFSSIEQISFIFFVGICHASSIMIGKTIGEGRLGDTYQMAKRFLKLTPFIGLVTGAALFLLRYPLLRLMPLETPEATQVASTLLALYACWLPVRHIPYICIVGCFRAGGDTKVGMLYDSFSLYCVGIPLVAVLGFFTNIPFTVLVLVMYLSEDILKCILCLRHFRTRRWIQQLTFPGANAPADSA